MHNNLLFIAGVLGLGGPELMVILVIVVLLFGGQRLPELAKGLGKSIKEFKRASQETDENPAPASPARLAEPMAVEKAPAAPALSAPATAASGPAATSSKPGAN